MCTTISRSLRIKRFCNYDPYLLQRLIHACTSKTNSISYTLPLYTVSRTLFSTLRRYPRIKDYEQQTLPDGTKLCVACMKPVPQGRRRYCSNACLRTFTRNHTWYFVRKDILRRDRYTCQICRQRFRVRLLDIDHIIPLQMQGQPYDKNNLRTLCKTCHKAKTRLDRHALQ